MSKLKNKYIDMIQISHAYIHLNFKQVDLPILTLYMLLISLDWKITVPFTAFRSYKHL